MTEEDLVEFTKQAMRKEGIVGHQIEITTGDEGFVNFPRRKILLGRETSKRVALHELAHILAGEGCYHYSSVFERTYNQLLERHQP